MSKAPDKIYILPMQNPADGYVGIAWSDKHGKMTEYIRKDALLEWAEHRLENLNNVNFNEDNYDAGKSHILSDLINKLNSM